MSSDVSFRSILDDPILMWDQRCIGDFTFLGRSLHDSEGYRYVTPGKRIEKLDEKIIKLYQSCGLSIREYSNINAKLQKLYENPPVSVEDRAEYLKEIQRLLLQLPEAMNAAQANMGSLANQLTEKNRKEYYKELTGNWVGVRLDKSFFGRPIRQAQKDLYQAATECKTLLLDQMQRHSSDIPKELYMEMVSEDLSEWKGLLEKIYHPETIDVDRQVCLAGLKARKDFIDPALSEILKQTDAKNEAIHESWREVQGSLDYEFSQAKFYTDGRDENLANLRELFQSNLQLYRERSLLYEQKLIIQGAHQEAVDYAIQWMESLPQDALWEDVAQMINLFLHANGKDVDAGKFLHALNGWTKNQPHLHSPDIPKELYMKIVSGHLQEWKELLDKIYDSAITDADKQECFTQLKVRKESIDPALSEILKQASGQNEDIHEGCKDLQDIVESDFSRAKFYTDSKNENLVELGELFQSNPKLYRERSLLYEQKLIDQGARQEAVDHGIKWMKSLSQEAPWEDVVQMTNLFIQANENSPDASEFLDALNRWVKDQPHLYVDSEDYFPLRRDAEHLAIARGSVYSSTNRKLSFEAAKCYQIWHMTRPDDLAPKLLLAQFHIANAEWDKSKQIIEKLPDEYSSSLSKYRAAHMFGVYSLPVEMAGMVILRSTVPFFRRQVLPGSMGDQALDVLSSAVQGASHQVLRRHWLPYCVGDLCPISEEPLSFIDKTSLGIFAVQMVSPFVLPPIFEFFVPDQETRSTYLQPIIDFCHPILSLANGGMFTYEAYRTQTSLSMPMTLLASAAVSLVGKGVLQYIKNLSPTKQAMVMTAMKVSSISQDIGVLYASRSAIASVVSYAAIQCGAQGACSNVGNVLSIIPATAGNPIFITASATSLLAYALFIDFPRARTGAVLEEALRRCHRKKYEEANNLLKIAEKWFVLWSDRPVIQKYSSCITFLKWSIKIENSNLHRRWLEKGLPYVDQTINALEKSEYYSNVKDDLRYHKIVAHLNTGQVAQAKIFLNSIDVNSAVHGHVVLFVIEKAKDIAREDLSKVNDYLNEVKPIFQIPEYLRIVTRYQEYFDSKRVCPVLPEDKKDVNVCKRSQILSSLAALVRPRKILRQLEESLLFEALVLHVQTENFAKAEDLLNQTSSVKHEQLTLILIEQAIECRAQNKFDQALNYLNRGIRLNRLASQPLLKAFKTYIELEKAQPLLTKNSSQNELNKRISALTGISQSSGKIDMVSFVQKEKLFFYIQVESFQEAAEWAIKQSIGSDLQDLAILNIVRNALDLSKQDAIAYLTRAHDALAQFEHRVILKKIQSCLPNDLERFASAQAEIRWAAAADDLIEEIKPLKNLASLYLPMKGFRFLLYIHRKEHEAASAIFNEIELPEVFQAEAIILIIRNSDVLLKEKGYVEALDCLREAQDFLPNLDYKEVLILYRSALASRKDRFTSPEKEDQWFAAQTALIDMVKPIESLASLYSSLEASIAIWCVHKREYRQALEKLKVCPSTISTEILLQIIQQTELLPPQESRLYLEDAYAKLEGFQYREILQLYKDCSPQSNGRGNSMEEDARWISTANAFITAVKPIPELSHLHLMMKASKCMFHVVKKEYNEAASILKEGILKNEFQFKILNYILSEAHALSRNDQVQEASIYLEGVYEDLEGFASREILLKFRDYLAAKKDCLSPESVGNWVNASEALIVSLRPIPEMLNLIVEIRCRQFEIFLNQDKFYDIKHVLEQPEIPSALRANLEEQLIGRLVTYFLKLEEFEQIAASLDISKHRLARKYRAFCSSLEARFSDPTSVAKIQKVIQQLDALSNSLRTSEISFPNWIISLQANLHSAAGELYWQLGDFRSSLEELSIAEPLFAMQNLPENQQKLAHIRNLKERTLVLMARV